MLILPVGIKFFQYLNIIDHPDTRKVHELPTPGTGGIIFFIPFAILFSFFVELTPVITAYLISVSFLVFIGLTDDISPISPYAKFFAQLLSAFLILSMSGLYLKIPIWIDYPFLQFTLAMIFIVGVTNSFNLIDGLDGLAAGLAIISLSILGLFMTHTIYFPLILLIIGSVFGFLRSNTFPAAIFMGDSGSYFLGYSIAVFCLTGVTGGDIPLWFPLIVVLVPMADTINVFIRRILKHKNIFMPDRKHIHYRIKEKGISHKNTVFLMYSLQMIGAIIGIGFCIESSSSYWGGILILCLLTAQHLVIILRDDLKIFFKPVKDEPNWIFIKFPWLKSAYIYYFFMLLIFMAYQQVILSPIQSSENIIMIFVALLTAYVFMVDHKAGRSAKVSIGMMLLAGLSIIITMSDITIPINPWIIYLLAVGVLLSIFGLFRNHHIFDSPTEYLAISIFILFALYPNIPYSFSISVFMILIYLVYKILLQNTIVRKYNLIYILNMITLILIILKSLP
ncbi:MAG: undecaprenyl/decaprenyl-phosphate alpha-N-acetylglucosaminyl 1-phosphate transferase [Candidatus Marinimicrobia bacterium]|jgi:UDP-GlcNAc:undecaprenyl-phosphate GlcNAc-1-phosphate transferase|nr:undecaprenyl/decaprenyl-phosphate alpha-N-acetylglucosaminyl 1-phosphate transferase [Candidatus Neomarinimicrobiota bacterium]MBT4851019.1 undecaprenyl/decaprenyl-phosphate alpha-N-acetylglucosaminyl 1-phosphate transferase [Candidatus Neomarinimicrobiota bacterium]MBT6713625.1 undecaprenyl/decaprenyl-phosphate alpha-N-acetylglucosaminyl 1-phosphate transferase [Candidatus Neomarinimicrobiota bacterium]MBT7021616.1 undecaprenyl/decaprenyl-phosphate alpha-N-acetylglucosaminyl 1-phosphate tran